MTESFFQKSKTLINNSKLMRTKHSCSLVFLLVVISVFLSVFVPQAQGAEIFFGTHTKEVGIGQQVEIGVFLNAEGESINAVEGKISFPSSLLTLKEIRSGNSVISFWVEQPLLESGGIQFSGVIPGGYTESNGYLFSIIFQTESEGEAIFDVIDAKALLNDGLGSLAYLHSSPTEFKIGSELKGPEVLPSYDVDAPESFIPKLAQDQNLFNGKWFLVFASQDKGSGIDHYEVREGIWNNFITVQSPHVVQHQTLDQKTYIKAVDKNGNERIEVFYPPNWQAWYKNYWIFGIIIVSLLLSIFILLYKWKKLKLYTK